MASADNNSVNNVNLSDGQNQFVQWLATPKSKRNPKTQKQLADNLGIVEETLVRWKDNPLVRQALRETIESMAGEDDSDIIEALKSSARLKGAKGAGDRKTYLQWRGWLVNKQEVTGAGGEPLKIEIIHADSPAKDT